MREIYLFCRFGGIGRGFMRFLGQKSRCTNSSSVLLSLFIAPHIRCGDILRSKSVRLLRFCSVRLTYGTEAEHNQETSDLKIPHFYPEKYTIIKIWRLLSSPPNRRARVARDMLFGRFLERFWKVYDC